MNYQNVGGASYPGQLQAISIIQTVIGALGILGGIGGGLWVLIVGIATMGIGLILIPIPFIYFVVGILSLVSGIKGLQKNTSYGLSLGVAIAQMGALFICDMLTFGCGLTALILLLQQEVKAYLGK